MYIYIYIYYSNFVFYYYFCLLPLRYHCTLSGGDALCPARERERATPLFFACLSHILLSYLLTCSLRSRKTKD